MNFKLISIIILFICITMIYGDSESKLKTGECWKTMNQTYLPNAGDTARMHKRRKGCCEGYKSPNGIICEPICDPSCEHGICTAPNACECVAGYTGKICNDTCNENFWGPNCRNKCDCKNADCNIFNGTCTCHEGKTGENCEEDVLDDNHINLENDHDESTNKNVIAKNPRKWLNIHLQHFVIFFGFFIIFQMLSKTTNDIQDFATTCNEHDLDPNDFERRFVTPNPYQDSQEIQYENIGTWQNADIIQKYYENPI